LSKEKKSTMVLLQEKRTTLVVLTNMRQFFLRNETRFYINNFR